MVIDYIKYVYGFTVSFVNYRKSPRHYKPVYIMKNGERQTHFIIYEIKLSDLLSPIAYYKAAKERDNWIAAAKQLKNLTKDKQ